MSQTRLYSGPVFSSLAAAVQGSTGRERKPANIRTLHPTACFIAAGIVWTRIVGGGAAPALCPAQDPPPPPLASSLLLPLFRIVNLVSHSLPSVVPRTCVARLVKVDSIC